MPGSMPGPIGAVAFVGVKFGGYLLAGLALKQIQPAIASGVLKIAAVRTGFGLVLGPAFTFGFLGLVDYIGHQKLVEQLPASAMYSLLGVLRVFVWALVIHLFTRRTGISAGKLWALALAGAIWSCLLDIPGIVMAFVSPGKIPFC